MWLIEYRHRRYRRYRRYRRCKGPPDMPKESIWRSQTLEMPVVPTHLCQLSGHLRKQIYFWTSQNLISNPDRQPRNWGEVSLHSTCTTPRLQLAQQIIDWTCFCCLSVFPKSLPLLQQGKQHVGQSWHPGQAKWTKLLGRRAGCLSFCLSSSTLDQAQQSQSQKSMHARALKWNEC